LLKIEGLTKRFGGFTAVNAVSFEVHKGEILGLIGPNGSGKSTIFNMVSGTLAPNSGSIQFDGREIAGQPPHRIINLGIGRTFQIPRPFRRLSLVENVVLAGYYGQGRRSRLKAFEAAERAGMPSEELAALGASRTLKMAALDGDVEQGKVELGQSVGLIDDLIPAAEVVARLVTEFEAAVARLSRFTH